MGEEEVREIHRSYLEEYMNNPCGNRIKRIREIRVIRALKTREAQTRKSLRNLSKSETF